MTSKQIVLITGANTGLGFEVVRALLASSRSYEILLGSRRPEAGEEAKMKLVQEHPNSASTISCVSADLSSDKSIDELVGGIKTRFGRLDILINNAGAGFDSKIDSGELSIRDAFNASWDTNVSGTQVLTTLTIPLLLQSSAARLVFITSGTSSLGETELLEMPHHKRLNESPASGWPKPRTPLALTSYRATKAGLNMVMREWVRILKHDPIKIWCASPGFLATGLGGVGAEQMKKAGAIDPSTGGDFVRSVVEGEHNADAGKVVRSFGDPIQMW